MWGSRENVRVVFGRAAIDPDLGATAAYQGHAKYVSTLKTFLSDRQQLGQIDPHGDLDAFANIVSAVSLYLAIMEQIVWSVDREMVFHLAKQCASILARGMAPHPGGGPTPDG
jgi:hypothetical protein